jgi:hypothetical protein
VVLRSHCSFSGVFTIGAEVEEKTKHDVVVALRLKEHLCMLGVYLLKQSKHFPETKSNSHSLQLMSEQLGVDLLVN